MFEQDEDFDFDEGFLLQQHTDTYGAQVKQVGNLPEHNHTLRTFESLQVKRQDLDIINKVDKKSTSNPAQFSNNQFCTSKGEDNVSKRKLPNEIISNSKKICVKQISGLPKNSSNTENNISERIMNMRHVTHVTRNNSSSLDINKEITSLDRGLPESVTMIPSASSSNFNVNHNLNYINKQSTINKEFQSEPLKSKINFVDKGIFSTTLPKVQKRKFPGPAGLLPDCNLSFLDMNNENVANKDMSICDNTSINEEMNICSQTTSNLFSSLAWKQMLKDYSQDEMNPVISLPTKYTISWLKKNAVLRKLYKQKSPFLAAIVQSIEHSQENHIILLKDQSDEILGTFDDEVWNEFQNDIQIGSVIVLKQVGVLTTNFTLKKHYLNITLNNIVVIYNSKDFSQEDGNPYENNSKRRLGIHFMNNKEILSEIEKLKNDNRNEMIRQSPTFRQNSLPVGVLRNNLSVNNSNANSSLKNTTLRENAFMNSTHMNTKQISTHTSAVSNSNYSNHTVSTNYLSRTPFLNIPQVNLRFDKNVAHLNIGDTSKKTFPQPINDKSSNNVMSSYPFVKPDSNIISSTPYSSIDILQNKTNISSDKNTYSDIESILDNTLDGIDTDSLFEDF